MKNYLALASRVGALLVATALGACSVDMDNLVFDDDAYNRLAGNGDDGDDLADAGDAGDDGDAATGNGSGTGEGDGDGDQDGGGGAGEDGGLPTTCEEEGEVRCTPAGELQICTAGNFETSDDCGGIGRCSVSRATCLPCAPGAFRCAEEALEQCDIEGGDFHEVAVCAAEDDCFADGLNGGCIVCEPDAVLACSTYIPMDPGQGENSAGFTTEVISCGGSGEVLDVTDSCRLETPFCDVSTGSCLACEPGTSVCKGAYLTPCAANGSELDLEQQVDCGLINLCDADTQMCASAGCQLGESQCTADGQLQTCSVNGRFETLMACQSQERCDNDYSFCEVCEPSSSYCNGDAVYVCNQLGTASMFNQQCDAGQCQEGSGVAGCTHGPCTGNGAYATCSGSSWYSCTDATTTPSLVGNCGGDAPICLDSNCVACIPGSFRCAGIANSLLEQCIGGSWNQVQDCGATGLMCSDRVGACLHERPGHYYCNADGDLAQAQADGDEWIYEFCSDDQVCDEVQGGCVQRVCVPDTTMCQGDAVIQCNGLGDDFDDLERCDNGSMCFDGIGCLEPAVIAAGEAHTCIIATPAGSGPGTQGVAMCWGANDEGQLGNGQAVLGNTTTPTRVIFGLGQFDESLTGIVFPAFTDICAGRDFSCATVADFEGGTDRFAACWGSNTFGQLGIDDASLGPFNGIGPGVSDGSREPDEDLIELMGVEQITCGSNFACLRTDANQVYCWGSNAAGQLGMGSDEMEMRVATQIQGHSFVQIAAGAQHACGVKSDGSLWCWGSNVRGQLGNGGDMNANEPVKIDGLVVQKTQQPRLGIDFSIVASAATPFRSFGGNLLGQLGNGNTMGSNEPVNVQDLRAADVSQISYGSVAHHTCALDGDQLMCWGANALGQLGTGDNLDRNQPVASAMDASTAALTVAPLAKAVAAGPGHTCAIAADNQVYCWGHNGRRQLGTALASNPQLEPIAVEFP